MFNFLTLTISSRKQQKEWYKKKERKLSKAGERTTGEEGGNPC